MVIDSDQGALGGNTLVLVENHTAERQLLLGKLVKRKQLYRGRYGEVQTIQLEWKAMHTLTVDGQDYSV